MPRAVATASAMKAFFSHMAASSIARHGGNLRLFPTLARAAAKSTLVGVQRWYRRTFPAIVLLTTCLAARAGRVAQPIATVQQQDTTSDRAKLNAEIQANNKRAEALASESGGRVAQNVAAGVVGVFV